MDFQYVFERYELKYLLSAEEKRRVLAAVEPFMKPDMFGRTVICNLYFDTETRLLARRSIGQPVYKEKLRVRSYKPAQEDSTVFVELKKKYDSVVFKRRIALPERDAMAWMSGTAPCPADGQIVREIEYFLRLYPGIRPVVYLSYEREAFFCEDGSDFRMTFDENIRFREEDLSLCSEPGGKLLLPEDVTLMELKCPGAIPLRMARILSEEHIRKTSFSKYGTAYCVRFREKNANHTTEAPCHV